MPREIIAENSPIARDQGLARLEVEVLPGNRSMLIVFSRCGLPMKMERLVDVVYMR
jgi:hypothetical protein